MTGIFSNLAVWVYYLLRAVYRNSCAIYVNLASIYLSIYLNDDSLRSQVDVPALGVSPIILGAWIEAPQFRLGLGRTD